MRVSPSEECLLALKVSIEKEINIGLHDANVLLCGADSNAPSRLSEKSGHFFFTCRFCFAGRCRSTDRRLPSFLFCVATSFKNSNERARKQLNVQRTVATAAMLNNSTRTACGLVKRIVDKDTHETEVQDTCL